MNQYKIIKNTYSPIISLEDLKNFLRVTQDQDDKTIVNMRLAAQDVAEKYTGFTLSVKEVLYDICANVNRVDLPYFPVSEIVSIQYSKEAQEVINLHSSYEISEYERCIFIDKSLVGKNLQIHYLAGYKDSSKIAPSIIQGIMLHVAEMYDRNLISSILPDSVKTLYSPYIKYKI
ncbi:MAG: hypothetical protein K0Q51_377 [Rickettsiaceae bacterium]|jgi:hypothetical protein|nr:hypothetical protein [Rickettsiaceae bacterium]